MDMKISGYGLKFICGFAVAGFAIFLASCGEDPRPSRSTSNIRMMDDTLIKYNKGVALTEDQEIKDFAARYGWDIRSTQTGLRYLIYKQGSGPIAQRGRIAVVRYQVNLLNGKKVYSSDSLGPKEFVISHGGVEPGLEEGILLLRTGDRAKFILPSRLAFGLLGDGNKIPPGAALVYDLELVAQKSPPAGKNPKK
jgi:FKBP-type peptidyl-prolyl cis-trans isomerase FkpA